MMGVQAVMANGRRMIKGDRPLNMGGMTPLSVGAQTSNNMGGIPNNAEHSMDGLLSQMETIAHHVSSAASERISSHHVAALCDQLKMFGQQLETVYKDQIDRCFVALRNGCRDDRLSLACRYRLLEVIELRAMGWKPNDNLINYYKQKLTQIEMEESAVCFDESSSSGGDTNCVPLTPTTPVSAPAFPHQYPSFTAHQPIFTQQQQLLSPVTPPALLAGEVLKTSGKYATGPVRVTGKNHCKDEIVIRNQDSGRVMGMKGRRVHMIEQMSETVISFQRVSPCSRERLVQITGTNDENINHAKQLIEETIRRNVSPARGDERPIGGMDQGGAMAHAGSSSSLNSHGSDEATMQGKRSSALADAGLSAAVDFRYSVMVGEDTIRITGVNLELVRMAKLVLDEYFHGDQSTNGNGDQTNHSFTTPSNNNLNTFGTPSPAMSNASSDASPCENAKGSKQGVVTVVRQPIIPASSKDALNPNDSTGCKNALNRRVLFAKTSEGQKSTTADDTTTETKPTNTTPSTDSRSSNVTSTSSTGSNGSSGVISYSREFLLKCATSPLSRVPPADWQRICRSIPSLVKKDVVFWDPVDFLSREGRMAVWADSRASTEEEEDKEGEKRREGDKEKDKEAKNRPN